MTPEDRRAIEQDCARLIARYFNLVDAAKWEAAAALFTPDGRLSRPTAPDDWIAGRATILAAWLARPARTARHICSNVVIDVTGPDEAIGECAIALFAADGKIAIGSYHDRFTRTADGWQFAERRGSLTF